MTNKSKKIKKFLRNKINQMFVELVETDPWGGDKVLHTTTTSNFDSLYEKILNWENDFKTHYGSTPANSIIDAPRLIYVIKIINGNNQILHREVFHNLDNVEEFFS